jgi:MFS family permease
VRASSAAQPHASAGPFARLRGGLDREVALLCLVIFVADVVSGVITPTFSLFAQDLGLSLAALGVLNTLGGATQFLAAAPLGVLSDRAGRTRVVVAGILAFAGTLGLYAVAPGPGLLFVGRMLQGVAVIATFQIGSAHLGDITAPGRRSVAFGSYTTAMGLGFTVGPLIGGQAAQAWGVRVSYGIGAALGVAGALLAWRVLRDPRERGASAARPPLLDGLRLSLRRRELLLVSFGNLLVSLTFAGAVSTFFPVYAKDAGLTEGVIGTLFAVRAFVSALGRLPNSVVTRRLGDQPVLFGAIGLQMLVMFGIARTHALLPLGILLAFEGLAYGAYLVAGQTWVADHTEADWRGAAVGLYSSAGSLGGIAAPLAFGVLADARGVRSVFVANGWLLAVGLALSVGAWLALTPQPPLPTLGEGE